MIHSSSIIDKSALIGDAVKIGPFCSIGSNVKIGNKVELIFGKKPKVYVTNRNVTLGGRVYCYPPMQTAQHLTLNVAHVSNMGLGYKELLKDH